MKALVLAIGLAVASSGAWMPSRACAQSAAPADVALACTLTGLEGALGTWVLAMPWGGFWQTEPQPGDPWALLGAALAGLGTALTTWGTVEPSPERTELVTAIAGGGAALAVAVALLGGLVNLLTDFDRLAVSLVYGVPILLAMTAGVVAGLVHDVAVGDPPPTRPSPLTAPLLRF
jgi:hypothetical protein